MTYRLNEDWLKRDFEENMGHPIVHDDFAIKIYREIASCIIKSYNLGLEGKSLNKSFPFTEEIPD